MSRVAYLIGIDLPGQSGTCDADVSQISKILHLQYGFQTHCYTSDGSKLGQAERRSKKSRKRGFTKHRFEALLRCITRTASRHSPREAIFYFAGHGINMGPRAEQKGGLVPSNGNPFDPSSLVELSTILTAFEASWRPPHLLFILDCCFATTQRMDDGRQPFVQNLKLDIRHLEYFQNGRARQILTSSLYRPVQASMIGRSKNSPFAIGLIKGLGRQLALDHHPKLGDTISVTQLHSYLLQHSKQDILKHSGLEPQLWSLEGHGQGEFVFMPGYWDPADPEEFVVQTGLEATVQTTVADKNPFKGLQYYSENDDDNFLGREREIKDLLKLLNSVLETQDQSNTDQDRTKESDTLPLVVLRADSGVGKSSLIRAGIFQALKKDLHWKCEEVTEIQGNKDQLASLFQQLQKVGDDIQASLHRGSVIRHLLIWDQFERLSNPELGQDAIPELLRQVRSLLTQYPQNVALLIGIRIDFQYLLQAGEILIKLTPIENADSQPMGNRVQRFRKDPRFHVFTLAEIEATALEEVIRLPAYRNAVFFESKDVIDRMKAQMKGYPKALGILNLMLSDMYQKALTASAGSARLMRLDTTNVVIDIKDYLIDRLERIYESLADEQERRSMLQMFLRLVSEFDSKFVRRIAYNWEFIFEDVNETKRLERIRRALTEAGFLLKPEHGDRYDFAVNPDGKVELAHDILADSWPLLRAWLDQHPAQFHAFQRLMALTRQYRSKQITGMDRKELRKLEEVLGLRPRTWRGFSSLFQKKSSSIQALEKIARNIVFTPKPISKERLVLLSRNLTQESSLI